MKYALVPAIYMVISLIACNYDGKETKKEESAKDTSLNLKVSITVDTSDYLTQIIESNNPEAPTVVIMRFQMDISHASNSPGDVKIDTILMIENPKDKSAKFSIQYPGDPNGVFVDNKKITYPLSLKQGEHRILLLKHGQTLDAKSLTFLKKKFADMNKVPIKRLLTLLKSGNLKLQNDPGITEQVFQVEIRTGNGCIVMHDVSYKYE